VRCRVGQGTQERKNWNQLTQDSGRQTANGFVYLGFPFGMGDNKERTAILPGARFTVEVNCHRAMLREEEHEPPPLRAALASMWALGHFGALGSRARRGFGAIALAKWRLEDRDGTVLPDADLERLPVLHRSSSADEWRTGAWRGIDMLKSWFGTFGEKAHRPHHPCFGSKADLVVWSKHPRGDWYGALRVLGEVLQNARQRKPPDYDLVKNHVRFKADDGGRYIEQVPNRATFGLPLTFRYRSLPHGKQVTFAPISRERQGSLLFLRPVLASGGLFGLFLRLDGDVPGIDTPAGLRGTGRPLKRAERNAMDEFINEMKKKAGQ
jgi:CRISPR-associated protein Cmr1